MLKYAGIGLGFFKDDPKLLEAAIRYLNQYDAMEQDNFDPIERAVV